ncbi:winged helix-turn-helix domain-containing protein [Photobacterium sanctipauli]|uniref:winged helix-turn-helix domain-containing protein n=1 Tax=Photobacterium sanctipauli TaxID=1342794 RepID=UPI0023B7D0A1|nr:winged helix-turn-helix domain-containing protein [Photobacterium sanctipauli]
MSRSECLIVRLLASTPNQAVSREILLEKCWTGKVVTSSSLNVAIKHIRSAFSSLGAEDIIVTEPKKGLFTEDTKWPTERYSVTS